MLIDESNTSIDKGFVDILSTADGITNLRKHRTTENSRKSPQKEYHCKQTIPLFSQPSVPQQSLHDSKDVFYFRSDE